VLATGACAWLPALCRRHSRKPAIATRASPPKTPPTIPPIAPPDIPAFSSGWEEFELGVGVEDALGLASRPVDEDAVDEDDERSTALTEYAVADGLAELSDE
jgi:hypothetical protein